MKLMGVSVGRATFKFCRLNVSRILALGLVLYLLAGCSDGTSGSQASVASNGTPSASANGSYSIRISTEEPTVKTTLSAIIEPSSPDNKVSFVWFRNGKAVQENKGGDLIGGLARKGNIITVKADITDINGNVFHVESAPVTIRNSPPRLVTTPEISATNNGLAVTAEAADDDGDPITLEYQWFENNLPLKEETSERLEIKNSPGNQYAVQVTPYDGASRGTGLMASAVRIEEQALKVSLRPATADQEITAEINSPGPPEAVFFEWLVNGMIVENETGPTLSHAHFKKGDTIKANVYEVPPGDLNRRILASSNTISVVNRPPIIEPVHVTNLLEGRRYETTVVAKDPDADPVTFTLEQGPDGMTLDAKSGVLQWIPPEGTVQPVHIVISASDKEGVGSRISFDLLFGTDAGEKTQP
jgi:hypothetical protein